MLVNIFLFIKQLKNNFLTEFNLMYNKHATQRANREPSARNLRHSVSNAPINSQDIVCSVTELNATFYLVIRTRK